MEANRRQFLDLWPVSAGLIDSHKGVHATRNQIEQSVLDVRWIRNIEEFQEIYGRFDEA